MPQVPKKVETIRCKDCGYTTGAFHGWVFIGPRCLEPGKRSMHHNWEAVVA